MGMTPGQIKRLKHAAAGPRHSNKHPIAAIEKRVIDSPAFASLTHSAVRVLLLLARNSEKEKNGRVWLSPDTAEIHGVERKTLYRALWELRTLGLIHQTRRGGNGQCSMYALTWLPLTKDTKGLHVDGFEAHAWRHAPQQVTKKGRDKFPPAEGQISTSAPVRVDKNGQRHGDKFPPIEVNTNTQGEVRISPAAHVVEEAYASH
jgi:hypothetical protein